MLNSTIRNEIIVSGGNLGQHYDTFTFNNSTYLESSQEFGESDFKFDTASFTSWYYVFNLLGFAKFPVFEPVFIDYSKKDVIQKTSDILVDIAKEHKTPKDKILVARSDRALSKHWNNNQFLGGTKRSGFRAKRKFIVDDAILLGEEHRIAIEQPPFVFNIEYPKNMEIETIIVENGKTTSSFGKYLVESLKERDIRPWHPQLSEIDADSYTFGIAVDRRNEFALFDVFLHLPVIKIEESINAIRSG